jgi:hypothetical protein
MMKNKTIHKKILFLVILMGWSTMVPAQTVSRLTATGTGVKWYAASTGGTALALNTPLVDGTTYYASQTLNGVESTTRLAVTATLVTQAAPASGTHSPSQTQIVWNWNSASAATGYKWSTSNNYGSASNLGNVLTNTEPGLTCNTAYTRYVWAYNSSSCISAVTELTQTTSACGSGDAIYDALSDSRTSYHAASSYDLVKITAAEYENVRTALSATRIGYTGTIDNYWATGSSGAGTTFSYNSMANANTTPTFSALNYPVAFSFHPVLNPQNSYSCQLKYNNGGTLVNISNVYSGATAAIQDRQYFVIKTPAQLPDATPYIAIYSSAGVATVGETGSHYWSFVSGNVTGSQTFTDQTGADTQLPSPQVLQVSTKQW